MKKHLKLSRAQACWRSLKAPLAAGFMTLGLMPSSSGFTLPNLDPIPASPAQKPLGSVTMGNSDNFAEVKMNFPIESGTFAPTWSSIIANYPTTESAWLRQAKFGIWVHFGPQAAGQSGDWYARRMYIEDDGAYDNHIRDFGGHPSTVGYKDLIRTWNPTALNPAALTQIYHDAGARFLMIQGVHHDQYDNWNSKYQPWNSVNLGPKRDILGEWRSAIRSHADMRYGVTFHHEYSWWWWQSCYRADTTNNRGKLGVPYDGNLTSNYNGAGQWWDTAPLDLRKLYLTNLREYAGIYNAMDQSGYLPPNGIFTNHLDYAHWYATWWALRMEDVIENYDPDFIYTDGASSQPFSGYGTGAGYKCDAMQRVLAHYFNRTLARRGTLDTFGIVKFNPNNRGIVTTFENEYPSAIKTDQPWIGEVPVGDWYYYPGFNYSPGMVIRYLLECVSRDGAAAINIALKPDGSLDPGSVTQLQAVGNWMNINSAGIYGSRAWLRYGEGTNTLPTGKLGGTQANKVFTTSDFRYTVGADGFLYAYCMTVPAAGTQLTLPSLGTGDGNLAAPITSVQLLGSAATLGWSQTATDLNITCPSSMPFQTSVCFKIGPAAITGGGGGGGTGVTFHQDYNFGGSASSALGAGNYTMSQLASAGCPNDWASSVRVPSGYTVTFYADDNFSGTSWTLTSDTSSLGSLSPGANDMMTSCRITSGSGGGAVANGTYKLIARHSGLAMDTYNQGTANGTQIQQWTYWGGAGQKWTVTNRGSDQYSIIGVQSGKAIEVNNWGTANGTQVQLWDYHGGTNQKHTFTATSGGNYRITPTHATGSCLDVAGVSTADGALVHLWSYGGANNQQWSFQAP